VELVVMFDGWLTRQSRKSGLQAHSKIFGDWKCNSEALQALQKLFKTHFQDKETAVL